MSRSEQRKRRPQSARGRRLNYENLEQRRVLAGVVNVVWPGDGTLALVEGGGGGGSDNQVQLASTANAGEFRVTGLNGTQVQLNGAGATAPDVLVNGIFADISSVLGGGSDYLEVAAGTTIPANLSVVSEGVNDVTRIDGVSILGDLSITNSPGAGPLPGASPVQLVTNSLNSVSVLGNVEIYNDIGNINSLAGSTINGGLWITKMPVGAGASHLMLTASTVVGPTIVTNVEGGVGGDTTTMIVDSQLVGQDTTAPAGLPAAVPMAMDRALVITNGDGNDKLDILGSTTFGEAPLFDPPDNIITVDNGDGGSLTTFGPKDANDVSRVTVYGGLAIRNGANLPGVLDMASFHQSDVAGMVAIHNAGGPGATSTMITDSDLGSFLAPAGPQIGSPVVVINDDGEDAFAMDSSTAWWGLFINNDDAAGGALPWPSNTSVIDSNIGTRPGGGSDVGAAGANLEAALAAVNMAGTALPGVVEQGDVFVVGGGMGQDVVNVSDTDVGGQISFILPGGNNSISLVGASGPAMYAALNIQTGDGNDEVRLENIQIPVSVQIYLDGGNDRLELLGDTMLPNFNVGFFEIDGGAGLDELVVDPSVTLPAPLDSVFELLLDFNN